MIFNKMSKSNLVSKKSNYLENETNILICINTAYMLATHDKRC
jgi:uncharacterized protein (DUF2164 family)